MSHKPMVYSERPIKTRTLDLMHKAELARRETNQLANKAKQDDRADKGISPGRKSGK